ncbi:uncharacterized protein LOC112553200 [Pomacea canaliculata]|nr:uncharacterized protein LOC112553200 [Pomacea canaliculata]XP_025076060.1 uncharacterized protein LOC112553200 [Pomacea canaliculata]
MSSEGSSRLFVRATNTDLTGRATPEPPSGTGATTVAFYSPTRSGTRPYIRDLDFWRLDHPVAAEANEAIWKKIEAVEESMRITPEAAESSGALVVKNVDLHEKTNALEHQTSAFECVQSSQPEAVFRRGMEIRMTITFNRPYDASKDRLSFVFLADIQNPAKNLRVEFKLDETGTGESYLKNKTWGARLDKDRTRTDVQGQMSVLVVHTWNCRGGRVGDEDQDNLYITRLQH